MFTLSQRVFGFLCCPDSKKAGIAQEAGRGHSQRSVFYFMTSCSAYKLGVKCLGAAAQEYAGHQYHLVDGEHLVLICIICFSWVLTFSLVFSFSLLYYYYCYYYCYYGYIKVFLSQPTSFLFNLPSSHPHPTVQEWVSSCVVLSCQLGLNCECQTVLAAL